MFIAERLVVSHHIIVDSQIYKIQRLKGKRINRRSKTGKQTMLKIPQFFNLWINALKS